MIHKQRAQKLLERCITKEELQFLQTQPEFVEATRHMLTTGDALSAIELGEQLVRKTWVKPRYPNPDFLAQNIDHSLVGERAIELVITTDSHLAVEQLLRECFTELEMALLNGMPEFTQAAAQAGDLHDGMEALILGARLIEKHRLTGRARPAELFFGNHGPERARM